MNRAGQGALEYLLLIGGAVLIAAIVITLVVTSSGTGQTQTSERSWSAFCIAAATQSECGSVNVAESLTKSVTQGVDSEHDCFWDSAANTCSRCRLWGASPGAAPPALATDACFDGI